MQKLCLWTTSQGWQPLQILWESRSSGGSHHPSPGLAMVGRAVHLGAHQPEYFKKWRCLPHHPSLFCFDLYSWHTSVTTRHLFPQNTQTSSALPMTEQGLDALGISFSEQGVVFTFLVVSYEYSLLRGTCFIKGKTIVTFMWMFELEGLRLILGWVGGEGVWCRLDLLQVP